MAEGPNHVNGNDVNGTHVGVDKTSSSLPKRAKPSGIQVLVVGSGPGGLLTALECWRKGHDVVRVLERSPQPMYTGDILVVQPSAMEHWRYWPWILEQLKLVQLDVALIYKKHTGDHIYGPCRPSFNDPGEQDGRLGPYVAPIQSRIKFYQMLMEQVEKCGIKIEFGKRVKSYFEDEAARKGGVIMDDGSIALADVVVAADGHSTSSNLLVSGKEAEPKSSGMAIYRSLFSKEVAFKDPVVRERWESSKPLWEFWLGPKMYMGIVVDKDIVSWGFTPRDDGTASESWIPDVDPEQAIAAMGDSISGWHPAVLALVRTAPKGSIIHSPLLWRNLRRNWTSPAGHVVQVGDSAHAFLPTSGNGATQAMEDAVTLAACLELSGLHNCSLGTKIYNLLRYERVACAQKMTFVNSQLKHETDWDEIAREPHKIRTRFPRWIYAHDPEAYAYEKYGQAFAHITAGAPFKNTNYPPGHNFVPWTVKEVEEDMANGKRVEDLLDGDWS